MEELEAGLYEALVTEGLKVQLDALVAGRVTLLGETAAKVGGPEAFGAGAPVVEIMWNRINDRAGPSVPSCRRLEPVAGS